MSLPNDSTAAAGQITLADLYRVMSGIETDLGKLLVRMETAQNVNTDHETRLRKLETASIQVKTIASSVGAAAGIASGIIAEIVSRAH